MKTRAAVALEKTKPLEIMDVDLDGPKAGEVLVEVKATGICHTDDFTLSGADPEGLFPAILGHEGAGIVVDVGPGVASVRKGDIAVAKIREHAPFDKVCYIGCGVTTGVGAVLNTAKVEPGSTSVVFGLGGIGLNVIQGLRLAGADMIIGVDINPAKKQWGERFGMTHFVNPKEVGGDLV